MMMMMAFIIAARRAWNQLRTELKLSRSTAFFQKTFEGAFISCHCRAYNKECLINACGTRGLVIIVRSAIQNFFLYFYLYDVSRRTYSFSSLQASRTAEHVSL